MTFSEKKQFVHMLQYNVFNSQIGWRLADNGRILAEQGKVEVLKYNDTSLECNVKSGSPELEYRVRLWTENLRQLFSNCDCSRGQEQQGCEHVVAAGLAVQKIMSAEIQKSWENRLLFIHETAQTRKPISDKKAKYLLIFALIKAYSGWQIKPLTARADKLPGDPQSETWDTDKITQLVESNDNFRQSFSNHFNRPLTIENCLNGPSPILHMAQLLHELDNVATYYSDNGLNKALPAALEMLREANAPLYLGETLDHRNTTHLTSRRLTILRDTAKILLELKTAKEGDLRLQFHILLGETLWKLREKPIILCDSPLCFLSGDQIGTADTDITPEQIENLGKTSHIHIPAAEKEIFLQNYLPDLANQFTIIGEGISTREVNAAPQPRLYLEENEGTLNVWLRFGYEQFELPYQNRAPEVASTYEAETSTFVRIFRDLEAEKAAHNQASDFGLKRVTGESGLFNLRRRVDVVDFLMRYTPKAAAAGFEIFGEENIKNVRVNRNQPTISFHISSGIDWFDLNAVIQYGDLPVSLKDMRQALKRRENYIKLADGTLGEVPQEWLERYKHLFNLGEENEDGLRFSNQQVTLLDQLLGESENVQSDQEFKRRRERLREFNGITPRDLPKNLTAELRPYQKAGVDWLHFLHDYQFGGCLADDMGLGKTVQVLAFLQALKETGASEKASLAVVPKSLLTNWQRESEKFTPGLRLLEYHGQFRAKDVNQFDSYDLVITTYGVVIKDIELLRAYRFNYAILDESQAIKNPLSQSAKACRLLQSDHRLVMTGTPVENSTFELWSQFAFINPGLLGSLDYFKSEIGGPIERDANADTAQLLRKLVYPFILRRTKEQVAPELPARTERIIYGDMEPAQIKIYTATREDFRKSLLGLIETEGVNNARMKILEGLLRLRQICIHPRLVNPSYHGKSAKFEMLLENIETLVSEGHKALIFSQFVQTLHLLQAELDSRGIHYAYLDGQTNNRQEQVDAFQTDPNLPLFLISLKAGGVGLNLTAADYVIHIDPWWNPAVEMQASDRAHRIGQEKPVFIYKYILRNTVEEKILQLQERKKNLVEQLISTEGSFFKSITAEDVKALFT